MADVGKLHYYTLYWLRVCINFVYLLAVNVSFTNFLLMEHLLHNPALLVFVDLMRSATLGDTVTSSKPCEYGIFASAHNGIG